MGTRGYRYNQIRVRIHIIMGSQIPVYYTRGYPLSYPPRARDGFYPWVPVGMGIFATSNGNHVLWLKTIPLKVNIFIWRLLLNWIATKDNLFRRNIIAASNIHCSIDWGCLEDMDNLFF